MYIMSRETIALTLLAVVIFSMVTSQLASDVSIIPDGIHSTHRKQ